MRGINIVGILVGAYLLWQSYQLVRNREESVFSFFMWLFVGSGLVVAGIFPDIFSYFIDILGMQERAFAMFAIGIFIAYLLMFRIFRSLKQLQTELSNLNEELSLLKAHVGAHDTRPNTDHETKNRNK